MQEQLTIFDTSKYTKISAIQELSKTKDFQYINCQEQIPLDLEDGSFISITRKNPLKIHTLGFQPAKTIPEIPRWFLNKYGHSEMTVLEPFSGSGTTLIESLMYGASVYWLDYNPLSRLICHVKTTLVEPILVMEEALKVLERASRQKEISSTVSFSNKDFWFQKPVQEALETLRQNILEADTESQSVLWLIFSLTVRKTSNMNDGMILAAKRSSVKEVPKRSRQDVFHYFRLYLDKTIEALSEWLFYLKKCDKKARCLSSRDARYLEGDWNCDAVITSPPYINAIDYIWASKFELHWLKMVENDKARLELYAQEIGTERIAKKECKELGKTGYKLIDSLIEDIYSGKKYQASKGQNELRARVVYKYFMDMKTHFESSFKHLKTGGYYCFSIGDVSKICGVDIPVASILTDLAYSVGFRKQFHFHLLLKNRRLNLPRNVDWAGTIKHDTVVVLDKPS
jgi:adenine-specific DNA methylase